MGPSLTGAKSFMPGHKQKLGAYIQKQTTCQILNYLPVFLYTLQYIYSIFNRWPWNISTPSVRALIKGIKYVVVLLNG